MEFFGLGLVAILVLAAISIGLFVFWIWMLVEVLTKEPSDGDSKLVWALVVIFLGQLGALLYFFIRRPERISTQGQ